MSQLLERLRENFKDEASRYAYVEAFLNASVAAQVKELRDIQNMSQQDLADKIGTKQSGISRLENANYSSWKVETLRKLARAFGLRLRISFEEFGTLVPEIENFKAVTCRKRKFADDPVFHPDVAEPKPPQSETVPQMPAMPQGNDRSQEPGDPLQEAKRPGSNLTVLKPNPRRLGGYPSDPRQTDLGEAQISNR